MSKIEPFERRWRKFEDEFKRCSISARVVSAIALVIVIFGVVTFAMIAAGSEGRLARQSEQHMSTKYQ
jgi:hypothetical protein